MRIYLPETVITRRGRLLKSITVLLYDFLSRNANFLLLLLLLMSCSTFILRPFSKVSSTAIKIFKCRILCFEMYINSLNHKIFLLIWFIQRKIHEQTKKTVAKFHENLECTCWM